MQDTTRGGQKSRLRLHKTSVQIHPDVKRELADLYPELTISEITRMALQFVLAVKPNLVRGGARFVTDMILGGK